jgi:hypothetical protein
VAARPTGTGGWHGSPGLALRRQRARDRTEGAQSLIEVPSSEGPASSTFIATRSLTITAETRIATTTFSRLCRAAQPLLHRGLVGPERVGLPVLRALDLLSRRRVRPPDSIEQLGVFVEGHEVGAGGCSCVVVADHGATLAARSFSQPSPGEDTKTASADSPVWANARALARTVMGGRSAGASVTAASRLARRSATALATFGGGAPHPLPFGLHGLRGGPGPQVRHMTRDRAPRHRDSVGGSPSTAPAPSSTVCPLWVRSRGASSAPGSPLPPEAGPSVDGWAA